MMMAHYSPGNTLLHRLSPLAKLAVLIAYCILIFSFDSLAFEAAALAVILVMAAATKSWQVYSIITSKFAGPMILTIFLMQVIFTPAGTVYLTIPLHFFDILITSLGIIKGLLMVLRLLTIILASYLFVATTDPTELAYALMMAGIPYRYGFMVVTMLRFAPVFELEFSTVSNAQKIRGLEIDKGGVKLLIKSIRYTLVPMIVSAL
ncbi:MAG TPA: energy-coupling factor transporter transmembrane component T, partial [Methanocella sp.]|nr:energy-coupling factor transporter transmembrane component T [Methanocella sp.]